MIKHIVMWTLRGESMQERQRAAGMVKQKFESLRGRIPGMSHIEVGVDLSRADYACDVVLYTEFEDQTAVANYSGHPEHMRVREELGDLRVARYQVDYEVS